MTDDDARGSGAIWAAGLVVAAGAGVATAHGLFQVAVAAGVPGGVAWLYPLITDGLALVAYAATARLHHSRSRRYAAGIVVLAAGLSGLAQAVYLAGALHAGHGAPVGLRFGVGAWPAAAAAIAAHLLHLIDPHATAQPQPASGGHERAASSWTSSPSNPQPYNPPSNPGVRARPTGQRPTGQRPTDQRPTGQRPTTTGQANEPGSLDAPMAGMDTSAVSTAAGSARERARTAARTHRDRQGALPTVTELAQMTGTSRGTAGNALKDLRTDTRPLHIVTTNLDEDTTT